MANLTDADKVIRNDVGKSIASKLDDIADAIVQQGGGAHSLGQLSDVDIDTTTLSEGQSIVYNETTQKFENGEVSTVAALDDLTDVSITSAQQGDSLRYDGNEWIAQPTTIEMTLAEWNAIADKQAWRNAHKNIHLVITDAPNLNATAQDISYDGSTDTVWDKVEEVNGKAFTQTQLLNTSTTTTASIAIPNFDNYDFVLVIVKGDNNNGISVIVPKCLKTIQIPFHLYAINSSETWSGYAIHANGYVVNGNVLISYLRISGFPNCIIQAFGIKYQ